MPTCLAITVGGSCAPIVTAIKDYQPDFVYFIASTGARGSVQTINGADLPCWENQPNILTQSRLSEDLYQVIPVDEPDSFADCYKVVRDALRRAQQERPGWRWIADYTGGTKTMSVSLVLTAMELDFELSLIKGTRTNLVKVEDGTEMAALVNAWEVRARLRMREGQRLFNQFAYNAAGQILEELSRQAPLSLELQHLVIEQVALCRAFDAWDRFDHKRARYLLDAYQGRVVPQIKFLKSLLGENHASGYEPLFDLLLNADRRAARGRYDDAVARLYRALELLAQLRLQQRTPPLDTARLDLSLLPEALRQRYGKNGEPPAENQTVRLGLRASYELLAALDDSLGSVYTRHENRLLNVLSLRNNSILAHGLAPLAAEAYTAMRTEVDAFVRDALDALQVGFSGVQFPLLVENEVIQRPPQGELPG